MTRLSFDATAALRASNVAIMVVATPVTEVSGAPTMMRSTPPSRHSVPVWPRMRVSMSCAVRAVAARAGAVIVARLADAPASARRRDIAGLVNAPSPAILGKLTRPGSGCQVGPHAGQSRHAGSKASIVEADAGHEFA